MRTLTLQMQASVDGFVESDALDGQWTLWDWTGDSPWDRQLLADFNATFEPVDAILLSRPMVDGGYIDHWTQVADDHAGDARFAFARRVVDAEKVVVTGRDYETDHPRTTVAVGELAAEVARVKAGGGGGILAFGGVSFAAALLSHGLVDELQLYVNPAAVGHGRGLFEQQPLRLALRGAQPYECGIVVERYRPANAVTAPRTRS